MSVTRLSDPQYKNWVEVGLAILITKKGLECYIQKAIHKFHTSCLNDTTLPNNTRDWVSYLTGVHRSREKARISWDNSDFSKWFTPGESWEIAKIFMAPLGDGKVDVVNAQTTDLSGLLNVLKWAPTGRFGVFPVGVESSSISNARKSRNLWAHAPSLQLADNERDDAFVLLDSLLQDRQLRRDKDVQNAVIELNKLRSSRLAVVEEKVLEVLTQWQRALAQDIIILKSGLTVWKEQVGIELEQIQDRIQDFSIDIDTIAGEMTHVKERVEQISQDHQSTKARVRKLEEQSQRDRSRLEEQSTLHFNPVCDRLREDFVGRTWLFNAVDTWLEKDLGPRESRVFCVWGGPGTGKSSWAREMVHRHEGGKLAGYHYCQRDNPKTCELLWFIINLKANLSCLFSDYAAMVEQRDDTDLTKNPEMMFDAVLTTPLQQLPGRERHFLIVDGIDEGETAIASCLAKLSFKLPSWLRVILTARHDAPAMANLFPNCSSESLDCISSNQPANQTKAYLDKDIHTFVKQKFENLRERSDVPAFFATDKEGAIKEVVRASDHCFLYAKLVMEHIFDGHVNRLPASLSEIYCLDFRRLFPKEFKDYYDNKVAPVLETILALQQCEATFMIDKIEDTAYACAGAGGYDAITYSTDLEEPSLHVDRTQEVPKSPIIDRVIESDLLGSCSKGDVREIFQSLAGYVHEVSIFPGLYRFSHSSLGEWLQDKKSVFYCDVVNGHRIMAQYFEMTLKKKLQEFRDKLAVEDSSGSSPSGSSGDEHSPNFRASHLYSSLDSETKHMIGDYYYHSNRLPDHQNRCLQFFRDEGLENVAFDYIVVD